MKLFEIVKFEDGTVLMKCKKCRGFLVYPILNKTVVMYRCVQCKHEELQIPEGGDLE